MKKYIPYAFLTAVLIASAASAQTSSESSQTKTNPTVTTNAAFPQMSTSRWRASKLIGVDVYNQQNEKVGDINELIVAPNGQIAGAVIGVGGFLGIGERNVLVSMEKLTFSSTAGGATTGSNTAENKQWYPDRAVLNTTKEQLTTMAEFTY